MLDFFWPIHIEFRLFIRPSVVSSHFYLSFRVLCILQKVSMTQVFFGKDLGIFIVLDRN